MRKYEVRPITDDQKITPQPVPRDVRIEMDGPTSASLKLFASRSHNQSTFRISPSLLIVNDGISKLIPLAASLATIRIAVTAVELAFEMDDEQRYYRISGVVDSNFSYDRILPPNTPERMKCKRMKCTIPAHTPVTINYDGHDVNGELFLEGSSPVLPFPMNVQRIHARGGDYGIIRPIMFSPHAG